MRHALAAIAMISALPLVAATTGEEDTIVINPINATDFEVIQGTNFGAAEFWCGAATFIERRSGRSELTALYVKRPRGPSVTAPGEMGVVFSTSDAGLPPANPDRVTLTVRQPGATLKSFQARRYCRDAFTRSTK
ncbi:hypothetical protein AB2B41_07515 [Marimonas sp. MJW-29]|uniref:Uncharacterized protein n=1 Tax=Sulfitobacter sediminis TaxID=3234186 RepID=A0ABV3RKF6_9RHOB